jgi:predicted NAD/FAD-binding protein
VKIAIIGGGIAGMVAAYLLNEDHDITLFEANDYVGGHTHTIGVPAGGKTYNVDTGFIVFNETTYPNFCTLMRRLGVPSQPSTMTFSVKDERACLEYGPHSLGTFFAQKKNLFSPSFWRMISEIFRFRRDFDRLLGDDQGEEELGPYLIRKGYSRRFIDQFLVPLGSSLWSADPRDVHGFPLQTFVRFFKNHGFLTVRHPIHWRVIRGGSRQYAAKLTASYEQKIRLNTPVQRVTRYADYAEVFPAKGDAARFDHVMIAAHSDQALEMLTDPSPAEREILSAIPYQENVTVLHTDSSILPKHRSLWSSWNYLTPLEEIGRAALTYDMNILQTISAPVEFCVTLNRAGSIAPEKVIGTFVYHHPIYRKDAPEAQQKHGEISGHNRTHYCGAYWGYGFHEDGVNSALAACKFFGKGL